MFGFLEALGGLNFVFEGDSITFGLGIPTPDKFSTLVLDQVPPVASGIVTAVSGSTLTDLNTRATSDDALINPSLINILTVLIGANDLSTSITAATFVADLKTYCLARIAAGWKVVVMTILPKANDVTFNAKRNSANTLIRADTSFYDALVDLAANGTIGPDAAATDTSLYFDGVHPTVLGNSIIAPIVVTSVNTIPR